ncbi:MAG: hypothetical protein KKF46_00455 [Nanoarchaeota archaeon]|nr:hypothetical protein [Nanoarchaeota archaeon]MBU1596814.1 hypothetical protein [Nanoarchaeota archaeon]
MKKKFCQRRANPHAGTVLCKIKNAKIQITKFRIRRIKSNDRYHARSINDKNRR